MKDWIRKAIVWLFGAVTGLEAKHLLYAAAGFMIFFCGCHMRGCWDGLWRSGDGDDTKPPLAFGWVNDPVASAQATATLPFQSLDGLPIKGTWDGKPVCLWKFVEKATGKPIVVHKQRIGSCVSHGYSQGHKVLQCV